MSTLLSPSDSSSQSLAEFVQQQRKRLKLTQTKLALVAGVGLRFVRELEAGKPTLQLDKVNQVLLVFGYGMSPAPLSQLPAESGAL